MRTRDYVIRMPKDTTVVAACEQAACENWRNGWDVVLDTQIPAQAEAAAWIRSGASGRTFRELPGSGRMVVLRFESRQRCFTEHRTKPARWLAGGRQVPDMSGWIDDLDNHVGHLAEQYQRG